MLVLASQSPRRAELLRNAAIEFETVPSDVPEEHGDGEPPEEYVLRLARDKALCVLRQRPEALVLGADTVVVVDQHIMEKPVNAADAERMLRMLSGCSHQVITGVCLARMCGGQPSIDARTEITEVRFTRISEQEISAYVESGEPMDKAGAYAIQGIASRWIAGITGCYFNVVGLPVPLVWKMMSQLKSCGPDTNLAEK